MGAARRIGSGSENRDELGQFVSEADPHPPQPVRSRAAGRAAGAARTWAHRIATPALAVAAVALALFAVVSLMPKSPAVEPVVTAAATPAEAIAPVASAPAPAVVAQPPEADRHQAVKAPVMSRAGARDASEGDTVPAAVSPAADPSHAKSVNAEAVKAMWLETDTRSLDRALSAVRRATLALGRCNVQLTSSDQAVARCDVAQGDAGSGRRDAAWTIEFRRTDERWLIEGISAR